MPLPFPVGRSEMSKSEAKEGKPQGGRSASRNQVNPAAVGGSGCPTRSLQALAPPGGGLHAPLDSPVGTLPSA